MAEDNGGKLFAHNRAFEWDDNKRRANVKKHGIDFEVAKEVFGDPAAYTYTSSRALSERRYVTVGMTRNVMIAVICTLRDGTVRIISARAARRKERQLYGREISNQES
jgi:uncharacterized DUF497 family protein